MPACSFCGAQQPEGARFCDECGRPIQGARSGQAAPPSGGPLPGRPVPAGPPPVGRASAEGRTVVASSVCPMCGVQVAPMDTFCGNCGISLRGSGAAAPPSEAAPQTAASPVPGGPGSRPQAASMPKVRCDQCGAEVNPESAFCDRCGAWMEAAPELDAAGLASDATLVSRPVVSPVQPGPEPKAAVGQTPPLPEKPVASELDGAWPDSPTRETGMPFDSVSAVPDLPADDVLARIVHPENSVGLALPVGKPEATLGRDDPVRGIYPDLDLTDYGGPVGGVSRLHACISIVSSESAGGFKFYIEDLDSVNGTFVNEMKIVPGTRRQLSDGDELRLGRVQVIFRIADREAKP